MISLACVEGSPSQPWPKLIIDSGVFKCSSMISTISSTRGRKFMRVCGATNPLSSGCSEMQPKQPALQEYDTGTAPSQRFRNVLEAVKHSYPRAQFERCSYKRFSGYFVRSALT